MGFWERVFTKARGQRHIIPIQKRSPSNFARNTVKIKPWLKDARITMYDDLSKPKKLDKVVKICGRLSSFELPRKFCDLKEPRDVTFQGESEFLAGVLKWTEQKPAGLKLVDEDRFHLRGNRKILFFLHRAIVAASRKGTSEASQRRPLDLLVEFVFSGQEGAKLNTLYEQPLRVCKSKALEIPQVTHRADICVGTEERTGVYGAHVPEDLEKDLRSNMVLQSPATDSIWLMVFAAEWKRSNGSNNQNQLIYSLSSGQCQRKALGLAQRPLFGAVCANGVFNFYVLWWDTNEEMYLAKVSQLDLKDPIEFLEAYLFMCNLLEESVHIQKKLNSLKVGAVTIPEGLS